MDRHCTNKLEKYGAGAFHCQPETLIETEYDYESDSELLDSSCDEHAVSSDNDFVAHAILTRKGIREKMLNSANCDCVTWNCEKYDFI
jgi:hypothetical protein